MSVLKVANIHFESTGTNRVEYVANNINFLTGGGNFTISVGGAESLNVNASSVMISGANILASVAAAYTAANNSATTANVTAAFAAANSAATTANVTAAFAAANAALANTDATFAGNLTLSISRTIFVGNATVNTSISAGSIMANGVAVGASVFQENIYTTSQTITIPTGATKALVRLIGGTGGSGGATSGCCLNYPSAGGAGGSGLSKILTGLAPGGTLALTIGAAGAAGSAAPGAGGTGGTSSLASGTQSITTLTAPGGGGSPTGGYPAATSGASGAIATNGDVNMIGQRGGYDTGAAYNKIRVGGMSAFGMSIGADGKQAAGSVAGNAGMAGLCTITWYS